MCYFKSGRNKRQPFTVPITIIFADFCIFVHKITISRIIRRIDIDVINLSSMGLFQQPEGMQIIALKDKIIEQGKYTHILKECRGIGIGFVDGDLSILYKKYK